MECRIYPFGSLKDYAFADIFAVKDGEWLLCRRKDRSTWEFPGGHIERGESPADAANRELYEETGARDFDIVPLCDYFYRGEIGGRVVAVNGQAYFARIRALGALPSFEMAEARLFPGLPGALTYPEYTSALMPFVHAAARGLRFRAALPTDLPLWRDVAKNVGGIMRVPDMHANAAFLEYAARKLEQNEAVFALDGEAAAGVAGFSRRNNSITWLGVAEAYRNRGVGTCLLRLALCQLDSTKQITVNTYPAHYVLGLAARKLYFKHGFRELTSETIVFDGLEMVTLALEPQKSRCFT